MLPSEEYIAFMKKQKVRIKQIKNKSKESHTKKLSTLKEKFTRNAGFIINDNWFDNKTTVDIPAEYKWILSFGKKFVLPTDRTLFTPIEIIADVEQGIQAIDENKEQDIARTKCANMVTMFKGKIKNTAKEQFILTVYHKTKGFLKSHKNIIIVQADKGNKR